MKSPLKLNTQEPKICIKKQSNWEVEPEKNCRRERVLGHILKELKDWNFQREEWKAPAKAKILCFFLVENLGVEQ